MKKSFGYIFIAIAVLNVIGFTYLVISNPNKLSNNLEYFLKKIFFAIGVGGLGLWLIQSSNKRDKDKLSITNKNIENATHTKVQ
ncbi:hypothetical protein [Pontibacter amylolyticus]|uniref:Uncharacterized protein n=1 Tax=Pontibacter amylolyticus TaxID=1424080 RepID=A0ABQ1W386_9BACT|nr:hypothetical protein [Pontibacter amylolyticus]GGG12799.1 hypothetical protein GCM10011323_16530 [Pontibacter amylolyticus]